MTDRDKVMFLQGVQFAAGVLPPEFDQQFIDLALRIVVALNIPGGQLWETSKELHRELDLGGFRGDEAQQKAQRGEK